MSLASLCSTHLVSFYQPNTTQDLSGGSKRNYREPPILQDLSCTLQPLNHKEKIAFGQRQIFYTNKLYFSFNPGVQRDWLAKVSFPSADAGRQFVVTGYADMAGRGQAFYVEVREQTGL